MSELKEKVVKSVFWIGGANAVSQAVTWVFTILIARLLIPSDYGLVAMASVYIGFAESLNEFGVGTALIQKKDILEEEVQGLYSLSFIFGLFFMAISFPAAHLLAGFFEEQKLVPIIYVLSSTFVISAVKNVQHSLMIRAMRFKEIAHIEVTAKITTSAVAYLCAGAGAGAWTLVISYLLYNVAQAALYVLFERRRPGRIKSFRQIKAFLHFGSQVVFARILAILSQRTDAFIIGKLAGTESLGIYSFAFSLAKKPLDKIMSVLNQVLFPVFTRVQDNRELTRRYFLKTLELELLLILPIFTLFFCTADTLVPVVLGEKWLSAVFPLKVFVVIGIFLYLSTISAVLNIAIGRPRLQVYYNAIVLVVMTGGMILFGTLFKFRGILLSWVTLYPLIVMAHFSITLRLIDLSLTSALQRFKLPLLISFAVAVVSLSYSHFVPLSGWERLVSLLTLGFLTYMLSFYGLDRAKALEIMDMLKIRKAAQPG